MCNISFEHLRYIAQHTEALKSDRKVNVTFQSMNYSPKVKKNQIHKV